MAHNLYDLLGVGRDAPAEEIKKAFKKAALQHHPDKGGNVEKFKEFNAAHEVLTDDRQRSIYDSSLIRSRSRDGMRSASYGGRSVFGEKDGYVDARAVSVPHARPSVTKTQHTSTSRPPRAPGSCPTEIPADPESLSVKELKALLSSLSINHEGCLEKVDLLFLLRNRKNSRVGQSREGTPQRGAPDSRADGWQQPTDGVPSSSMNDTPPAGKNTGPSLRIKVLSLGSEAVGKSCLIKRYCEGRFVQKYITTIGVDYGVKPVQVADKQVKVNFFDTSGGDEFKEIRWEFYEHTNGVILVYDVTKRQTFESLEAWLSEALRMRCSISSKCTGAIPFVVLCANKTDLPRRMVSREEGAEFAAEHGMQYFETSAASGDHVTEAFDRLFAKIVARRESN